MSETIERAAKALARHDGAIVDDQDWDGPLLAERGRVMFRSAARVMIEAMRELGGDPGPRYSAGEYSRRNHEAMIDDALGQEVPK